MPGTLGDFGVADGGDGTLGSFGHDGDGTLGSFGQPVVARTWAYADSGTSAMTGADSGARVSGADGRTSLVGGAEGGST